mgnify:CR=1 FL=1
MYRTEVPWSDVGIDKKLPVLKFIEQKAKSMDPAIEKVAVYWGDADERVMIALEKLIPRALEIDFPISDLIIDPLVLTVSGCQEYCPELIEAVRTLQYAWDPPPPISVASTRPSSSSSSSPTCRKSTRSPLIR